MKTSLRTMAALLLLAWTSGTAPAEEKNGLHLSVLKRTINRSDDKFTGGRVKKQVLAVTLRNSSIRDFPPGELRWTIVVKRSYEGGLYKYSGTEPLKALRYAESVEMLIGEAHAARIRAYEADYRDRVDYEVVVIHGDKESIRTASTPNFAALAAEAVPMDRDERLSERRSRKEREGTPDDDGGKPEGDGTQPVAGNGGTMKPDGTKPAPGSMPPKDPAMLPNDAPAVADASKPMPPQESGPALPPAKPFDFFNLDKTKRQPAAE